MHDFYSWQESYKTKLLLTIITSYYHMDLYNTIITILILLQITATVVYDKHAVEIIS